MSKHDEYKAMKELISQFGDNAFNGCSFRHIDNRMDCTQYEVYPSSSAFKSRLVQEAFLKAANLHLEDIVKDLKAKLRSHLEELALEAGIEAQQLLQEVSSGIPA